MPYYPPASSGGGMSQAEADARYAQLAGSNSFTVGQQEIVNDSAASVGFSIKGAASQSDNLQEWKDSSSTTKMFVSKDNLLGIGSTANPRDDGFSDLVYYLLDIKESFATLPNGNPSDAGYQENGGIQTQLKYSASRVSSGDYITLYGWSNLVQTENAAISPNEVYGSLSYTIAAANSKVAGSVYIIGSKVHARQDGTFVATSVAGADITGGVGSEVGAGATDLFGVKVNLFSGASSSVTNAYGIYVSSVPSVVTATNKYAIKTAGGEVQHETGSASTIGLSIKGFTSQSANLQEWQSSTGVVLKRVNKDGYSIIKKTDAPADGDLSNSEITLWFDATAGSLKVKGKKSDGTVVTGEVVLA